MKILVFSDTHKNISSCVDIIYNTPDADAVIHAGDLGDDAEELEVIFDNLPFYYVCGNNDIFSHAPQSKTIVLAKKRIFITHGHTYGVRTSCQRLVNHAKSIDADVVVFGHTHRPYNDYKDGIYVLNPGSMGYMPKTYGEIEIKDEKIYTKIIPYN